MILADFLHNPSAKYPHAHCGSLVELGNGDLLATWYCYPEEESKEAVLTLIRKPSLTSKWETSKIIVDGFFTSSLGNPVLYQHPEENRLMIFFVALNGGYWDKALLYSSDSFDCGITWERPQPVSKTPGMMVRHSPVFCKDGFILVPAYDESTMETVILQNAIDGWAELYRFKNYPLIQPALVEEDNGQLTLLFRPIDDPRIIWRSHSNTNGRQWSAPVKTTLPCPLSGVAAFSKDNKLYAVYNHTEEHQRHPLSIASSTDSGITWSEPVHIDEVKAEISYPHFIVSSSGDIHGIYTYNRRMMKYVNMTERDLP